MRSEGLRIVDALNETFAVGRAARIPVHVSHLKLDSRASWGRSAEVLGLTERARKGGVDVTQDVYTYTAFSTGLGNLLAAWAREGGRDAFKARLADPAQRVRIEKEASTSSAPEASPTTATSPSPPIPATPRRSASASPAKPGGGPGSGCWRSAAGGRRACSTR